MATDSSQAPSTQRSASTNAVSSQRAARAWPGVVLVAMYWTFFHVIAMIGLPISTTFFCRVGGAALFLLSFLIWSLTNRTVPRGDRWLTLLITIVGGAATVVLAHRTVGVVGVLFTGIPLALSAWAIALFVGSYLSASARTWLPRAAILGAWVYMMLLRMDGIDGELTADVRWRWSASTEDAYLAHRRAQDQNAPPADRAPEEMRTPIKLSPGDWTSYRGPERNGVVRGVKIATDWQSKPPQLVWREKIGPAWSSMLVIDGRVFTQEQVGDKEAVVCLDAASGHRIWEHEDEVRFWDGQSGAGPRATPAFVDGRLYTQGATGVLSCLDASDGKVVWTRNIADDSGAAIPMWGFSASPLVLDGLVITYAGGPDGKGLLAYRADSGEPAWSAATGPVSYCSAQPLEVDGRWQALILSDEGLLAVDAASGKEAWRYDAPKNGIWRAVQPGVIGPATVLIGAEDFGIVLLDVVKSDDGWKAEPRWTSKSMRPAYNDFVVQDGFLYGFDANIFCCINLEDGKRRWKAGRYGHGQVVLLAEQKLLLVTSETGDVVLMRATPEKHEELGSIAAIHGKTWNHPAVVGDRLLVRNDEEIAFYRLPHYE